MQDYKSLYAAVRICATLTNIKTDRQTHRQTTFWPAYSSVSWTKNETSRRSPRTSTSQNVAPHVTFIWEVLSSLCKINIT